MMERILNTGEAKICEGCTKSPGWVATGYLCGVYDQPRKTYGYRMGECAFNQRTVATKKTRVRVGQQKQSRRR